MTKLRYLFNIVDSVRAESSSAQMAWGVIFGMLIGLNPINTPQWYFFLIVLLLVRLNLATALFSFLAFKTLSPFLIDTFDWTGTRLLGQTPLLAPLWSFLDNAPLIPYTHFNNTVVLGALVASLVLAAPLFLVAKGCFHQFLSPTLLWIRNTHFWRTMMGTRVCRLYFQYQEVKHELPLS